ncbi:MAG TPA: serine O-acetyltransferase [Ruminococcaceae bacterium]|nr:serine O-acetyltransferase [Oscillospiraceae bacterium]
MLERFKCDIKAIKQRDPAARNMLEIFLLYPGLHAIMWHRPAHWLYKHKFYFTARLISQLSRFFTGIEIHPGAKIGKGVFIDHGSGVVIGETAEVGDNCTIYQGVTLGGTGKDTGKRHPTLGDNVLVGAGARILGPFKVGSGAKIAANAVVLAEIPENATAVGVPARVVRLAGKKTDNSMLDMVHIPDPISQELCRLNMVIEQMQKKIDELEKKVNVSEEL